MVQMQLIHSMIRDDKIAEKPKHSYLSSVNRSYCSGIYS